MSILNWEVNKVQPIHRHPGRSRCFYAPCSESPGISVIIIHRLLHNLLGHYHTGVHDVRPVCPRQDDTIFCCEVGGHSIDCFAGPDAGLVIGVAVDVCRTFRVIRSHSDLAEHSAVSPLKRHVAIGQDVPVSIVGQARAVDRGQLILPGGIAIAEVRSFRRKVRDSRERISCL